MSDIAVASELLLALMQAWAIASKNEGLSLEESKQIFNTNLSKFMAESAVPVEEVKK